MIWENNREVAEIEVNEQFAGAFNLLENGSRHCFITGRAGTGKSTLLKYFREHTSKNVAVLAPTGVAAVNVRGQTIHSFFRFKPNITPDAVRAIRLRREAREIYRHLDAVMIDEVSMVRADLMDCIDAFLRLHGRKKKEPFGGVQLILIGDLYQLPPVVTRGEEEIFRDIYASPYFFDAKVFQDTKLDFIDLEKIYRQQEDHFISLLNAIREKTMTGPQLRLLNERYRPDFEPADDDFYVYLTTTNAIAERINQQRLGRLAGRTYHYLGHIDGKFEKNNLPTHEDLDLKIGAQVMLLNNDPLGRWVNGSIGRVAGVTEDLTATDIITVELEGGRKVEVTPFSWEMFRFFYDGELEQLRSETVGSFRQYPLKLAWAVTIHKSQGKTFTKVILDIGSGAFAHGQTYVALSRCTRLEGLVLKRRIAAQDILLDGRVSRFFERQREWSYHDEEPL